VHKNGYACLVIFFLVSGALSSLVLALYQAHQAYMIAIQRYHYYQIKYELDGLMNYAAHMVLMHHKAQRASNKKSNSRTNAQSTQVNTPQETTLYVPSLYTQTKRYAHTAEYGGTITYVPLDERSYDVMVKLITTHSPKHTEHHARYTLVIYDKSNEYEITRYQ
jgi:hypothetical protein